MKKRVAEHDEFADIRDGVRALCAKFPGEYWRALDRERAYPTDFVGALTKAGYLAALIPRSMEAAGSISPPPPQLWRRYTPPAAMALPVMRRCTRWARSCVTAAMRKKNAICR